MTKLVGARYVMFIGAIVGAIGLTLYPIVIKPMMNSDDYKQLRKEHPFRERKY